MGASLRYLSQRFSMPYPELKGLLTDIGTEELGHLEMIGAIVHQLTRNLTEEQIKTAGFDAYFVDRTAGVYPTAASGFPYSAASMACKGDLIADLTEDLAADGATIQEQRGRKPLKSPGRWLDRPFPAALVQGQPVKFSMGQAVFNPNFTGNDAAVKN